MADYWGSLSPGMPTMDEPRQREDMVNLAGRLLTNRGMRNYWGSPPFYERDPKDVATEFAMAGTTAPSAMTQENAVQSAGRLSTDKGMRNYRGEVPDVFQKAMEQYPIIGRYGVKGKISTGARKGYLEFWPPGEGGPPDYPRPEEFGDAPGVEIYHEETRPIDVLGDVTSHWLIEKDPVIRDYYQRFQNSLTDQQRQRLREQYEYNRRNFGETRPYDVWERRAGLPGYFRGYAFKQWPDDFNQQAYTPQQRLMFDQMMQYLTEPKIQRIDPKDTKIPETMGIGAVGRSGKNE